MKLFGSFKLTDRIRIGASTGGSKKSKNSKKVGCGGFLGLGVILLIISGIASCFGGDDEGTTEITTVTSSAGIASFDFINNAEAVTVDVGDHEWSWVKLEGSGEFDESDILFVSSDESIATFEFDKFAGSSIVYYYINGIAPGTAEVHIETADGTVKSDPIKVTVIEDETTTEEPEETEAPATTTEKAAETTSKEVETTAKQTNSRTVYKTPTGKRYHYDKECAGENAIEISLDDAKDSGYTACKTCVD